MSQPGRGFALWGAWLQLGPLFGHKYRAPWFFWFLAIYAGLSLIAFPVGTIIGVIILVHIIPKKSEFDGGAALRA